MYLVIGNRPRRVSGVINTPMTLQRAGTDGLPGAPTWRLVEWRCQWELRTLDYGEAHHKRTTKSIKSSVLSDRRQTMALGRSGREVKVALTLTS